MTLADPPLRIATRGSDLALTQTRHIAAHIAKALDVEDGPRSRLTGEARWSRCFEEKIELRPRPESTALCEAQIREGRIDLRRVRQREIDVAGAAAAVGVQLERAAPDEDRLDLAGRQPGGQRAESDQATSQRIGLAREVVNTAAESCGVHRFILPGRPLCRHRERRCGFWFDRFGFARDRGPR